MSFDAQRELVRYMLKHAIAFPTEDWTVQGFGFIRLRVTPTLRLHIWDSRFRVSGVSDLHDHAQWSFDSTIIAGSLVNCRYSLISGDVEPTHHMATIKCGIGGGMSSPAIEDVILVPCRPEVYEPGISYHQDANEIHRTYAQDGTVTLLEQERHATDTARVFFPLGSEWRDAIPRRATEKEIDDAVMQALCVFGK